MKRAVSTPLRHLARLRRRVDRTRLRRLYSRWVAPGSLCFDVGANVGERSDLLLSLGARVVCVEPQPVCIELLRCKYEQERRVTLVEKALGAAPGTTELHLADVSTLATTEPRWKTGRFRDRTWGEVIEVPVTSLDRLVESNGRPSFCKIDVEGAELEVLRGLSSPLQALSFEYTEEFLDQARHCVDRLREIGFERFNFTVGESPRLQLADWAEAPDLFRSLGIARRAGLWGDIYARSAIDTTRARC